MFLIYNACKKKNNLYRNFLKCKSTSSLCRYKAYKNKLATALRYAEKEYHNRLLYEKKDDIKGTWKIINSMIKGNKSNVSYPEESHDKGQCIKNGKSIADGFNNFFTNVGPTLACDDRGSFPLFTSVGGGARLLYFICLVVCPLISGISV